MLPLAALLLAFAMAALGRAEIVNTVTATGDIAGTPIVATATEVVDVADEAPAIALIKTGVLDDGGDGVASAGDTINYTFTVTNTGNVTLTNVAITDPLVTVSGGPIASLAPGSSDAVTFTAAYVLQASDIAAGQVSNQATATGAAPDNAVVSDLSDAASIAGNGPTVTPFAASSGGLTKTASKSEVRRGERVTFTIIATGIAAGPVRIVDIMPPGFTFVDGSATVNGVAAVPVIDGRNLIFDGLSPDASGNVTVKLTLTAASTIGTGRYVNNAERRDPATDAVIASARATVTIVVEHVFDCGEIIGRVFDDKNRNGYSNYGEPGLPGVRLATVKGLLVTTDAKGRFHVPCADIPDAAIGTNFLMKLDERTLPTGYAVTSENPRDVRLTRGKITKLNFGAAILRQVALDLEARAFAGKTTALKPEWQGGIAQLIEVLAGERSILEITYVRYSEPAELAKARLAAIKKLIEGEWKAAGGGYRLAIDARVVTAK